MTRFIVTYRIATTDRAEAAARADAVALEQTVEVPRDVVPEGFIADQIVGRVEALEETGGAFAARISYSAASAGHALPQLLNVIFGNSSLQRGLQVTAITPGAEITARFPGARFGAAGLRRLSGAGEAYVCPVLKPQGLGPEALADLAHLCARAGAEIVKEDHGLADQKMAPFRARVTACARAVARANEETGANSLFFANLAGRAGEMRDFALHAQEAGAHGLLVMPGLYGFGAMADLAADPGLELPIMAHPSFLGGWLAAGDGGMTHAVIFATLMRLAGADISVFPNFGGRFGFSREDCAAIAAACAAPDGPGRPIIPGPGGGMSPERVGEMRAMYGRDTMFLLGGSLLRHGPRIGERIAAIRAALAAQG